MRNSEEIRRVGNLFKDRLDNKLVDYALAYIDFDEI